MTTLSIKIKDFGSGTPQKIMKINEKIQQIKTRWRYEDQQETKSTKSDLQDRLGAPF